MNTEVDEVVAEFLMESHENLDQLDNDFISLEGNPEDRALIASVFRTIHTIKGTCGFLGFTKLESLTHAGENLLSRLRDGALTLDEARTSALLLMVDEVRTMMSHIESSGTDGDDDCASLIAELTRLADADATSGADETEADAVTAEADTSAGEPAGDEVEAASEPEPVKKAAAKKAAAKKAVAKKAPAKKAAAKSTARKATAKQAASAADPAATDDSATEPLVGEKLVGAGVVSPDDVDLALHEQDLGDERRVGDIMVEHGATSSEQIEGALAAAPSASAAAPAAAAAKDRPAEPGDHRGTIADSTIRVDVTRLDRLMNLVGELVLSRNNIMQAVADTSDRNLTAAAQRLDVITSDLQENLMKTRMQPVGSAWAKMPRIVREVAQQCHKQVKLEMVGEETELDKSVIDAIRDPLTHLVRNAIDHGIEAPEARLAKNKPADGRLILKATHESGQVVIEITDDGGGINADKVKAKAISNGLLTPEAAEAISEREANNLIFLPGFSTADQVTAVSGRGVGMDVVKTKVEEIGGTVDVTSRPGLGSTFTVKIPLTLAIVPALLVRCASERFAIPEINVIELVQLRDDGDSSGIEMLHDAPVYRLRGKLLPLVDLRTVLNLPGEKNNRPTLAVLQADDRQFGLLVDEVVDTQEIVVKPLSKLLSTVSLYAGATIMGDGLVALILDVLRLGQHAHVLTEGSGGMRYDRSDDPSSSSETNTMLLVAAGDRRAALRLDQITRLERFSIDALEWRGHQQVVQYRGEIMPIVQLGDVMSASTGMAAVEEITVVVCGHGPHVGLMVDAIIDICVTDTATIASADSDTVVLQERVTEIVDVERVLAAGGVYLEPDASYDPAPYGSDYDSYGDAAGSSEYAHTTQPEGAFA